MTIHELCEAWLGLVAFAGSESTRRNGARGVEWGMWRLDNDRVLWD